MREDRIRAVAAIIKGLGLAAAITVMGMLVAAAVIVFATVSDNALTIINQVIKIISVISGAFVAVRVNRRRGFAVGACVGLLYMILGCGMYYALAGGSFTPSMLAVEFAIGGVVGALSGSLCANYALLHKK